MKLCNMEFAPFMRSKRGQHEAGLETLSCDKRYFSEQLAQNFRSMRVSDPVPGTSDRVHV